MKINYDMVIMTMNMAKHIYIIGDGGSAALSDHFACDLLKNCRLPAISLCSNTAILTAIGNDYSFDDVFSMQLDVLFQPDDLLIIFSGSGNSVNLINVIAVIGGGILKGHSSFGKFVCVINGKDQMELEDNMLVFCHEVTRRLSKV